MVATGSARTFAPLGSRPRLFALGFFLLMLGIASFAIRFFQVEPSLLLQLSGIASSLILTFGGLTGLRRAWRWPECAITMDDDGLWPAHQEKSVALLRWQDIAATRENLYWQQTELLDDLGRRRLLLDYRLEDQGLLRDELAARMRRHPALENLPQRFSLPARHFPLMIGLVIFCFATAAHYLGAAEERLGLAAPILGTAGVILSFITLQMVSRIELSRDELKIDQPLRSSRFTPADLEFVHVEVKASPIFGACRAVLGLRNTSVQKVYFESLPPTEMLQVLEAWRKLPSTAAVSPPFR